VNYKYADQLGIGGVCLEKSAHCKSLVTLVVVSALLSFSTLSGCSAEVRNSTTGYRVALIGDSVMAAIRPELVFTNETGATIKSIPCDYNERHAWEITSPLLGTFSIHNYAVGGITAKEWSSGSRLSDVFSLEPNIYVVLIGGNDYLDAIRDGVITEKEREEIIGYISELMGKIRLESGDTDILILNYYDLFDGKSSRLAGHPQMSRFVSFSDEIKIFDGKLRELSDSYSSYYLDLRAAFMHHGYGAELGDEHHRKPDYFKTPLSRFDVHPTVAGRMRLAELLFSHIPEILLRKYADFDNVVEAQHEAETEQQISR
jgi:lysophospholipase L1-like esterase